MHEGKNIVGDDFLNKSKEAGGLGFRELQTFNDSTNSDGCPGVKGTDCTMGSIIEGDLFLKL